MVKRIFHSKIFVLFLSMLLAGFIAGYAFSVFVSSNPKENRADTSERLIRDAKYVQKEISNLE